MNKVVLPDTLFSINTAQIFVNKYIFLGLTCYGASMLFWLYVLTKVDVSRAYPFVGLGFIGTMLFAYYFLNEPITAQKIVGTFLVVSGVVLLAR
jgi:multidrug transporter EmrE-like cation transporter